MHIFVLVSRVNARRFFEMSEVKKSCMVWSEALGRWVYAADELEELKKALHSLIELENLRK